MKNVLDITKLSDKIKVFVPKEVLKKIKYLCYLIPNNEWSGVLFYDTKGTIKKPSDFEITLKDILPMDKGSSVSTEFSYDKSYVEYLMKDDKRTNWKSGLIHSHNNMEVFYSGTDEEELRTNSKAHNFYLSVVVNNRMSIIGRVALCVSTEKVVDVDFSGLDEQGEPYKVSSSKLKVKSEKFYYYDCDIICEDVIESDDFDFIGNVGKILDKKTFTPISNSVFTPSSNNSYYVDNSRPSFTKRYYTPDKYEDTELYKFFLQDCLNVLYAESLEDSLDILYAEIKTKSKNMKEVLDDFIENFNFSFEDYFKVSPSNGKHIIRKLMSIIEDNLSTYAYLAGIYNFLKKLSNEYTKY